MFTWADLSKIFPLLSRQGWLSILSHQKGGLLEEGGLIGEGASFIFQVEERKTRKSQKSQSYCDKNNCLA